MKTLLALLLSTTPVFAVDQSYCALYAREAARIDIMHTAVIDTRAASSDYILNLSLQIFKECISILPAALPLPPEHRNMETWVEDMRLLLVSRAGSEPAGDSAWREQCRAEYNTWNEATGTVVRRGSPERVPCPCGKEVNCE